MALMLSADHGLPVILMNTDGSEKEISAYQEYPPTQRLSPYVECLWSHRAVGSMVHRVLPDGCTDIVLVRTAGGSQELLVVGTMTRARLFEISNVITLGVRFRPGMSSVFIRVPGHEIVDQSVPLEEIWGSQANGLNRKLAGYSVAKFVVEIQRQLANRLDTYPNGKPSLNSAQCALSWAVAQHGNVSVDDLAAFAGLSTRHLRRVCLELTGVTPKQLLRAIRLRQAAAQLINANRGECAIVALDHGYYDQAHFTNEFCALSGITPSKYRADSLHQQREWQAQNPLQ